MIPSGIVVQNYVDDKLNTKIKTRVKRDCIREVPYQQSTNSRCAEVEIEPKIFAIYFLRILHKIHALRLKFPNTPILLNKHDLDAVYRRLNTAWEFAVVVITSIGRIAYILFRLPFGSRTAPGSFYVAIEMVMDSSQYLLEYETCNPDTLSSIWKKFIPKPQLSSKTSLPKPFPLSMEV